MIERYTLPEMGKLWSEENKLKTWLKVEIAVCEALQELNYIDEDTLSNIKEGLLLDIDKMKEIEKTTQHDIVAFIESITENMGKEANYIHLGMTSSDVLDTANALLMKESLEIIEQKIKILQDILKKKAYEYKDLIMVGRTHGIHAEPITLGLKFTLWYSEFKRNLERLKETYKRISVGKISGAVGTYSNLSPEIEIIVCKKLGLVPEEISTQIIQRDTYAEYIFLMALIASTVEKIATEIRNLQRTEARELEEPFSKGQKGSSAMPHKRNPVKCEQLCGLSRLVRSYVCIALENQNLWHERDISHSSAERIILPDASIVVDYMLHSLSFIIENINVYPENIKRNLNLLNGLIYSSGLLTELMKKGLKRKEAYKVVQDLAMKGWEEKNFLEAIRKDKGIKELLKEEEIERICDPNYYVRYRNYIYDKVFQEEKRNRIKVYVRLKPTVLDPQGKTIKNVLNTLSYNFIKDVRQGKLFELTIEDENYKNIEGQMKNIAERILSNPLIEEYFIQKDD